MLYEVSAADPISLLIAILVLCLAGCLACLLPALHVVRVNPVKALREWSLANKNRQDWTLKEAPKRIRFANTTKYIFVFKESEEWTLAQPCPFSIQETPYVLKHCLSAVGYSFQVFVQL
jgi:hypothetical protein